MSVWSPPVVLGRSLAACECRAMRDDEDTTSGQSLTELADTVEALRRRLHHLEERVKNLEER